MPMDRASVQAAFRISNLQGNFAWSDDSTTMYFTPTKLLDFNRSYAMSFGGAVKPAVGNATSLAGVENTWAFTTSDATRVISHNPDDRGDKAAPSNSFGFVFNNPLAPNQNWGSFLSVSPNPDGTPRLAGPHHNVTPLDLAQARAIVEEGYGVAA